MSNVRPKRFLTLEQCLSLRQGYLVTVNMQHIYESQRSRLFTEAIFRDQGAHHCLDGRGAAVLFRRAHSECFPLVQGNVLLDRWLTRARHARLLVIGSKEEFVRVVSQRYPHVSITLDDRHIAITTADDAEHWATELASRYPGPWDLIAIALGVPKQEVLAQSLQHKLVAPIYCIGGSFEILANALPRSPTIFQYLGLEGVWRLFMEPSIKRWKRLVRSYMAFIELRLREPSLERLTGGGQDG